MDITTLMLNDVIPAIKEYAPNLLLTTSFLLAALKIFGKKLINLFFQKDLENYKNQLVEKTTYLKTSLSIYAEEQSIANKRVDNQMSEAIHLTYSNIANIINPISKIITGTHFLDSIHDLDFNYYVEWAEKAHQANLNLCETLTTHAIYFDKATYIQLTEFSSDTSTAVAHFLRPIREHNANPISTSEILIIIETNREKLETIFNNDISPMKAELITKFRKLLGIEKRLTE